MEENAAKMLKIAWMTFPLGILVTLVACIFVFWSQNLSLANPYAQAILIHGNVLCHQEVLKLSSMLLILEDVQVPLTNVITIS